MLEESLSLQEHYVGLDQPQTAHTLHQLALVMQVSFATAVTYMPLNPMYMRCAIHFKSPAAHILCMNQLGQDSDFWKVGMDKPTASYVIQQPISRFASQPWAEDQWHVWHQAVGLLLGSAAHHAESPSDTRRV